MRTRVRYTKTGKIRFLGHRDVARVFERALRRADLAVVYSEGFSPRPRVHFGLALSTGHESLAEYIDVDLVGEPDIDDLPERLTEVLPEGIDCVAVAMVPPGAPSLQQAVTSCDWQLDVTSPTGVDEDAARAAVASVLGATEVLIERTRKGRQTTDDVRPAVLGLEVVGPALTLAPTAEGSAGVRIRAELATQPRGLRPSELLTALEVVGAEPRPLKGIIEGRVLRLAQWTSPDGARREEPLPCPATRATHAGTRAS